MTRGTILLILLIVVVGLVFMFAITAYHEMTADVNQANRIHVQALQEAE